MRGASDGCEGVRTAGRLVPLRKAALRVLPFLLTGACAPVSAQAPEREFTAEEWRADLDTMAAQMKARHWNLFHTITEEAYDSAVAALKEEVGGLSRAEILVEIARIAALVGDGHTRMWLNQFQRNDFRQLPIRLYRFEDGWHVRSVDDRHGWAAGRRVEEVEGVPVEEVFHRVSELIGQDNAQTAVAVAPAYMIIPEVLHALGITDRPDRATFRLVDDDGTRDLTLEAIAPSALPGADIGDAPPGIPFDPAPDGHGVRLVDAMTGPPPLWLEEPGRNHLVRHLPERDALYVRLTRIGGTGEESLLDFMERTYDEALRLDVGRYVLDLRRAWGGNNQLVLPAVLALVRRTELDRAGRIRVILGRHTFSATTTLVSLLDRMTHAHFVGEPTGGRPNYFADARPAWLPRSGHVVGVSSLYWQDNHPADDRPWHPPQIAAPLSAADYVAGRDPVLEAALEEDVGAPLRARLEAAAKAGATAEELLRIFRDYQEDPRLRWVHEFEATPLLFHDLGDQLMVNDDEPEAAVAAWTAGLETHPEPEQMRRRLEFVEAWRDALGRDRTVPAAEREMLTGSYGGAEVVAEGEELVYVTPSGSRYALIPLGGRTFALAELGWIRVRFQDGEGAPDYLELVFYDGETPSRFMRVGG